MLPLDTLVYLLIVVILFAALIIPELAQVVLYIYWVTILAALFMAAVVFIIWMYGSFVLM